MKRRRNRSSPPEVAFIIETSIAYGREILHGAAQYLRENGPWTIFFEHRSMQDPAPPWLADWHGDGIITTLYPQYADLILKSGIPTVDVDDQWPSSGLPRVQSDQRAIGALAAEHLLERGFTQFAFIGYGMFEWACHRRDGFETAINAAGHSCEVYRESQFVSWAHQLPSWEAEIEDTRRWIVRQPKPLGLMACNDFRGVQALDACRRARIAVPEEVAVIGVDNETLACELAYPPLSSVIPDCRRIGYEAAELLDQLMRGETPPKPRRDVPPYGVVTRQSSDVIAIPDPLVASAMRFIREHACDGILIEDVVEHVAASRSVLQRRFRSTLGRTIHDTIASVRLQRVKQLLVQTDLPLPAVADRAGFQHVEYLIAAFRKATGSTPGGYRKEYQKS
jgi:LacI family transcriptional regulator